MHLSKSLYATALLAGSAGFVLTALTMTEITDDLQSVTNMIDNVISDVNDLTIATGGADTSTIVAAIEHIGGFVDGYDEEIAGTSKRVSLSDIDLTSAKYAGQVADLFDTLGEKAGDFVIFSDREEVEEAANSLSDSNDSFLGDLGSLGSSLEAACDNLRTTDDEAEQDMDNDDAETPLRRRRAFRCDLHLDDHDQPPAS
ncbi:MAG: hypothetical protein ASARMPRED_007224 [Alectoria sarmentosa]|nr:MAG: hypothetical protein ASARMPRED_007224 [Alectoria sarmentosa]